MSRSQETGARQGQGYRTLFFLLFYFIISFGDKQMETFLEFLLRLHSNLKNAQLIQLIQLKYTLYNNIYLQPSVTPARDYQSIFALSL